MKDIKARWYRAAAVVGAFAAAFVAVLAVGGTAHAATAPTAAPAPSASVSVVSEATARVTTSEADATAPEQPAQERAELPVTGVPFAVLAVAASLMVIVGIVAIRFARNAP